MSDWVDPDDAPLLTKAVFDRAERRVGSKVICEATGRLTRDFAAPGRPPFGDGPKPQVSLRLDRDVIAHFRALADADERGTAEGGGAVTILEKWAEPKPVKLTIEDFLRLDDAGAFRAYTKTELIGGTIVATNAQFSLHAQVKTRLLRRIADAVDAVMPGCEALSEVSVAIPPNDLPEPDIVVAAFAPRARTPVPVKTVKLLVEVAETTLAYDLGEKARLYAAGGVQEYWVVDVNEGVIHRMWAPDDTAYEGQDEVRFGTRIAAATIDGLAVETEGL